MHFLPPRTLVRKPQWGQSLTYKTQRLRAATGVEVQARMLLAAAEQYLNRASMAVSKNSGLVDNSLGLESCLHLPCYLPSSQSQQMAAGVGSLTTSCQPSCSLTQALMQAARRVLQVLTAMVVAPLAAARKNASARLRLKHRLPKCSRCRWPPPLPPPPLKQLHLLPQRPPPLPPPQP